MLTIIFGLFLLNVVFAQFPGKGHCPSLSTKPDFDLDKHSGVWYPISRSAVSEEYIYDKCAVVHFSNGDNTGTVQINGSSISTATNKKLEIHATATTARALCGRNIKGCAKFRTRSNGVSVIQFVLDTDYISYSVSWTCVNFLRTYASIIVVYAREKNPDQSVWDKISGVLQKNNLQKDTIFKIDQTCS